MAFNTHEAFATLGSGEAMAVATDKFPTADPNEAMAATADESYIETRFRRTLGHRCRQIQES